jgi:hypothetical protein
VEPLVLVQLQLRLDDLVHRHPIHNFARRCGAACALVVGLGAEPAGGWRRGGGAAHAEGAGGIGAEDGDGHGKSGACGIGRMDRNCTAGDEGRWQHRYRWRRGGRGRMPAAALHSSTANGSLVCDADAPPSARGSSNDRDGCKVQCMFARAASS